MIPARLLLSFVRQSLRNSDDAERDAVYRALTGEHGFTAVAENGESEEAARRHRHVWKCWQKNNPQGNRATVRDDSAMLFVPTTGPREGVAAPTLPPPATGAAPTPTPPAPIRRALNNETATTTTTTTTTRLEFVVHAEHVNLYAQQGACLSLASTTCAVVVLPFAGEVAAGRCFVQVRSSSAGCHDVERFLRSLASPAAPVVTPSAQRLMDAAVGGRGPGVYAVRPHNGALVRHERPEEVLALDAASDDSGAVEARIVRDAGHPCFVVDADGGDARGCFAARALKAGELFALYSRHSRVGTPTDATPSSVSAYEASMRVAAGSRRRRVQQLVVDGNPIVNVASLANDHRGVDERGANCELTLFLVVPGAGLGPVRPVMALRATRDVPADSELLLDYGQAYWDAMRRTAKERETALADIRERVQDILDRIAGRYRVAAFEARRPCRTGGSRWLVRWQDHDTPTWENEAALRADLGDPGFRELVDAHLEARRRSPTPPSCIDPRKREGGEDRAADGEEAAAPRRRPVSAKSGPRRRCRARVDEDR